MLVTVKITHLSQPGVKNVLMKNVHKLIGGQIVKSHKKAFV